MECWQSFIKEHPVKPAINKKTKRKYGSICFIAALWPHLLVYFCEDEENSVSSSHDLSRNPSQNPRHLLFHLNNSSATFHFSSHPACTDLSVTWPLPCLVQINHQGTNSNLGQSCLVSHAFKLLPIRGIYPMASLFIWKILHAMVQTPLNTIIGYWDCIMQCKPVIIRFFFFLPHIERSKKKKIKKEKKDFFFFILHLSMTWTGPPLYGILGNFFLGIKLIMVLFLFWELEFPFFSFSDYFQDSVLMPSTENLC